MFNRIKHLFGFQKSEPPEDPSEKLAEEWYNRKSELMTAILGREHDMVMHAIIPFAIGGGLDLYYYPHAIAGTAIATKELSELPQQGSSNDIFACYEIAMFTREPLMLDQVQDSASPFGRIHSNINHILNLIARYSSAATLNPFETCEFPSEMEHVGGKCLIFDAYGQSDDDREIEFGILAVIEIYRSELVFARSAGGSS